MRTPPPVITLDDLATIAAQLQPLVASTSPASAPTARRIEAIFRLYGISFIDAPDTDGEQPCR